MKKLLFFSFILIFLASCNDNDSVDDNTSDCTDVACTEIFISLSVSVKDTSGASVTLDRFEVLDTETLEDITAELITNNNFEIDIQTDFYPLYSDLFVSGTTNTTRTLLFNGYINDELLVNAEYIIDTDCCHISLTTGNTEIIIN